MRIIDNGIISKLTTYLVFRVAFTYRRYYRYELSGSAICLLCGKVANNGNCESYENNRDYEDTAFLEGICNKCFNDLNNTHNYPIISDIAEFLHKEEERILKRFLRNKSHKADYRKIKKYKVKVPEELVKIMSTFLIKQGRERLNRYKARILKNRKIGRSSR